MGGLLKEKKTRMIGSDSIPIPQLRYPNSALGKSCAGRNYQEHSKETLYLCLSSSPSAPCSFISVPGIMALVGWVWGRIKVNACTSGWLAVGGYLMNINREVMIEGKGRVRITADVTF